MALMATIVVGKSAIIVASLHKVTCQDAFREIEVYISEQPYRVVLGGDQPLQVCALLGLELMPSNNSWPASCDSYGTVRVDILCTNLTLKDTHLANDGCND